MTSPANTNTKAEQNVAVVRAMFAGVGDNITNYDGYVDGAFANRMHPKINYYGHGPRGQIEICLGRDSVDNLNRICSAYMDRSASEDELVDCWAAGEDMVITHIRLRRKARATGEVTSYDCVMLVRVEDGMVTKGVDLVDKKCEEFWARTVEATYKAGTLQ